MQTNDVSQILSQIRAMSAQASTGVPRAVTAEAPAPEGFSALLSQSLNKVNQLQVEAGQATTAFERGDSDTDVASVMISLQKASLSFEAVTQVRNRLVSAYQDIMNMSV